MAFTEKERDEIHRRALRLRTLADRLDETARKGDDAGFDATVDYLTGAYLALRKIRKTRKEQDCGSR